ncbi:MAG: PAS domain S-box protein, partial [Rhodospirillales bacterium]|nr:PAS domain S-box protein [Rhodospirillales bacterium]
SYGELLIIIDRDQALSAFFDRAIFVVLAGLARNLLLAVILFYIFHVMLSKPLERIAESFSRRDPQSTDNTPISVSKAHEFDEIGEMVNYANQFMKASSQHLAEISRTEEELRQTMDDLIITNKKLVRARDALEESEGRFRGFAENGADWFWEMGPDLRFSYLTGRVEDIMGLKSEDILGKTRSELYDGPNILDDYSFQPHLQKIANRESFTNFDVPWVRPDGGQRYLSLNGKPGFDKDGEFLGYRGIGSDITDRKIMEKDLRNALGDAEQANLAKSEFLASMSHELRTPLNAVLGFAQMLQLDIDGSLSKTQRENVKHILEGGELLLNLVNEVLDLARIESDQFTLSLSDVNANETVANCVALANPLGEPRGVRIDNQFSPGPESILRTDHTRFKQVLINLLSNAVKYNTDGGVVTIQGWETDTNSLRLSVTDTGIGIAEEHHASVFQMFHRVGADAMVAREGTGIGLTVAKLLVERLYGHIGFESEVGVGSTFWIELPLAHESYESDDEI